MVCSKSMTQHAATLRQLKVDKNDFTKNNNSLKYTGQNAQNNIIAIFIVLWPPFFIKCRLRYSHLGDRNQSKRTQLALCNNTSIIVTLY